MAEGLELLFKLKAQNQASPVVHAVQSDVTKLTQSVGGQFTNLQQVTTRALGGITQSLTNVSSRVPVLGTAVSGLSNALSTIATESTGASAGLVGVAGAAGVMVVGLGAAIAVGVKLGTVLFDLTKQTAEFNGKFFDLSQQVGLAVETLSTLDIIASTTGGNIETVSAAMGIFQKNLEASHDPTSKEAKLLKELGVTSLDTEVALRQALAGLFRLGEGAKQTESSLQLFSRSGRFVNAILKESEGDLDAATKKFSEMGLVVSSEAARAADLFNDSLEILNRQLAAIGRQLVSDTIPVFIVTFQQISTALTGNKESWQSWGREVSNVIAFVIANVQTLGQTLASGEWLTFPAILGVNFNALVNEADKLRNRLNFEADVEKIQRITRSILAGRPGDTPDAAKATANALARANKEISAAQKAFEESFRFQRGQLERDRDLDLKSIEEWASESIRLVNERNTLQTRLLDQELAVVRKYVKDKADLQLAEAEIAAKRQKLTNETLEALQRIEDEAQKRREQSELRLNQQLFGIREAQRAGELEANKRFLEQGIIFESEALRRQLEVVRQSHADREILRDLERAQLSTSADRKIELDNEKIESEQRLTNETLRLIDERRRALSKEAAEGVPRPGGENPNLPKAAFDDSILGPVPDLIKAIHDLSSALERLGERLAHVFGLGKKEGRDFAEILQNAIDDVAFSIGDLVHQWVLLGETGPAAMRKLTASVLAGLAAQAAVKAVMQLAEGFAALFFNPAAAVAHFKAAALFGAVAGAAAIAGRAVAGDLFKPQSSAGDGGSGSSPQPLNTIAGRNQSSVVRHEHVLRIQSNDSHIVGVVSQNYRDGGELRELVLTDGVGGGG